MQTVTKADLDPHGWNCEDCARPFQVGDIVYDELTGMVEDTPCYSNFRCIYCQESSA